MNRLFYITNLSKINWEYVILYINVNSNPSVVITVDTLGNGCGFTGGLPLGTEMFHVWLNGL